MQMLPICANVVPPVHVLYGSFCESLLPLSMHGCAYDDHFVGLQQICKSWDLLESRACPWTVLSLRLVSFTGIAVCLSCSYEYLKTLQVTVKVSC